ncbi:ferrous iron transporter B [Mycoplasmatota bacterium WC44]
MENNKKFYDAKKIAEAVQTKEKKSFESTISDKVDRYIAHKWLGVLAFGVIMYLIFTISQVWVGPVVANFLVGYIEGFMETVEVYLSSIGLNELLSGLIVNGILGGFAAVMGFLPLIMVLFFLLGLLEDSGYMSRVAVVMDRFFKKVGLSGKSIIPMYVSSGCAIPGIMASKTVKNPRQRRTTILLSPFVPCGAKGPVIALFVGVFFANKPYMTAITYFSSLLVILLAGYVIKSFTGANYTDEEDTYLLVELPEYKVPSIKKASGDMWSQAKEFIVKATSIYVLANTIVWVTSTFNWQFQVVEDTSNSILSGIASPFAILLIPLGFGVWQLAAAAITGFVAKEEVVATLTIIFMLDNAINEDFELIAGESVRNALESPEIGLTAVAAFAFMCFNLFTPPCFAAIGAMKTQLKSRGMTWFGIALQFAMGFIIAMTIYQVGTVLVYHELGNGFVASLVIYAIFIGVFLYLKKLGSQGKGLARIE